MKKLFTLAAIAGLAISVVATSQPKDKKAATYKVDAKESTFKWTGAKVTGEHFGNVTFSEGTITTDGKAVTGGTFVMDMNTISVKDMQGEYAEKLEGHLKSGDFFAVDKFKTSTLKITSITPIAGAKAGQKTHNVTADLTIKDITKPVSFPAQIIVAKDKIIANAEFNVDRTLYDITYKGMADNLIKNDFTVNVRVIAKP
jgi:polyisoprenoid-binding protein YceI